jgi:hypothetical protein
MKVILAIVAGLILLMIIFAIFPMILTGSDAVNNTTNATQYLGLVEINNLSPLLIFIGLIFTIGCGVWLAATERGQRFISELKEEATEYRREWRQRYRK